MAADNKMIMMPAPFNNRLLLLYHVMTKTFKRRFIFYEKTILLIHTGGTISMAMSAEGAVMPNKENPLMKESNKLAS